MGHILSRCLSFAGRCGAEVGGKLGHYERGAHMNELVSTPPLIHPLNIQ